MLTPPFRWPTRFAQLLQLEPRLLAAARRRTDALFGTGLREEIFRPMAEALSRARAKPHPALFAFLYRFHTERERERETKRKRESEKAREKERERESERARERERVIDVGACKTTSGQASRISAETGQSAAPPELCVACLLKAARQGELRTVCIYIYIYIYIYMYRYI